MAKRRLFSLDIVDTDKFLELPSSSQSLYFHLGIRADDDGFVSSPKKICSITNCSNDDIQRLISKGFIIAFDSGIIAITDWNINNSIRKDRYTPTKYIDEFQQLCLCENGTYIIGNQMTTILKPNDSQRLPQDKINQDNSSKGNLIQSNLSSCCSDEIDLIEKYRSIIKDNIEYDIVLSQCGNKERLDEIVEIMLECICFKGETIRIAKNEISSEVVKNRMLKINSGHIDYVINCIDENKTKIRNIKEYLKTVLFNAPVTIEHYYTAKVNHDLNI